MKDNKPGRPPRPSNVGPHDVLTVPEAARWVRVDPGRLRRLLAEAGCLHTGLGAARVIAGDVLALLRGEPVGATGAPPPKVKRKGRQPPPGARTVSARQPLPLYKFD